MHLVLCHHQFLLSSDTYLTYRVDYEVQSNLLISLALKLWKQFLCSNTLNLQILS